MDGINFKKLHKGSAIAIGDKAGEMVRCVQMCIYMFNIILKIKFSLMMDIDSLLPPPLLLPSLFFELSSHAIFRE